MPEVKQMSMSNVTVYETTNYDMFRYIDGNRKIDQKHVKELAELINRDGQQQFVLITPSYGIYDGQHRVEACRQLGIPVKWIFTDKEKTTEDVQNLNISPKKWTQKDFLYSLAQRGSQPARRVLQIMDDFSVTRTIAVKAGGKDCHVLAPYAGRIKDHAVKDPFDDNAFSQANYEEAVNRLGFAMNMIEILRTYNPISQRNKIIDVFISLDKVEGFNRKRLEGVLKTNGDEIPTSSSTYPPILKKICKIYNSNKRKDFMDVIFNSKGGVKKIVCTATENRWA